MSFEPEPIALRPATGEDRDRLLDWRNDAAARVASRETAPITAAEHRVWFERVLADSDRHVLIGELAGTPIGQVRLDRIRGYRYEISVTVDPRRRGRGMGTRLIEAGTDWLWRHTNAGSVEASARSENEASVRAFRSAGYRDATAAEPGFVRLECGRPEPWAPTVPGRRPGATGLG